MNNRMNGNKVSRVLTAGLVGGFSEVIIEISLATLIFSGALARYSSIGIGFALTGAMMICIITALISSYPGTISAPQDASAVIMAQLAAGITGGLAGKASSETMFVTVVAALVVTTLCTGLFFMALGWGRAGRLIRYVPYPVIGGFLAGTGLLLLTGSIDVMANVSVTLSQLPALLQPYLMIKWLPGVLLGVLLLIGLNVWDHYLVMPGILLLGFLAFYATVFPMGYSISGLQENGFLLGPFTSIVAWNPVLFQSFSEVRWDVILHHSGTISVVMIVSVISLLLNAGGIELETERELDVDHELTTAGATNLLAGWTGCPVGYHSLSMTYLSAKLGGHSRIPGIIIGICCGAVLVGGAPVLALFPRFILGGILAFLGLTFLYDWLYRSWFELPYVEYGIVLVIMTVIVSFGFLEGMGLGLLISVVLFTLKYGSIDVVKQKMDGDQMHSNVERPAEHQQYLRQYGDAIQILRLQGFIFFGTSHTLLETVKERIGDASREKLRYVIFDFQQVPGFDSSARISFVKLMRLARSESFELVLSDVDESIRTGLEKFLQVESSEDSHPYHIVPDLDRALEFCEERLLENFNLDQTRKHPIGDFFQAQLPNGVNRSTLLDYFNKQEVREGAVLIEQGEQVGDLFYIESGEAEAKLRTPENGTVRLSTMRPGSFIGEIGLYRGAQRSATVEVTRSGHFYSLSEEDLSNMEEQHPEVAIAFHKFFVKTVSERLVQTNQTLTDLLR